MRSPALQRLLPEWPHALRKEIKKLPAALRSIRAPAIDSRKKLVDDLRRDALVVEIRAGYVPPSHRTVQSDQPRDTITPEIMRPKVARVLHRPRVVCSSAVRS